VKELVMPFRTAKENFFRKENHQVWGRLFNAFIERQKQLEINTMKLIDDTFKDLRSSEGAFDLLNNFKNIDTLPEISTRLQQKYTDVLKSYRKELVVYRELFQSGKASYEDGRVGLVISRGKPPVAGIISWAKSLMARMKGPIVKFNKN
jgi:dynein heavy chain, axonemal